jgi:hypothetical protein
MAAGSRYPAANVHSISPRSNPSDYAPDTRPHPRHDKWWRSLIWTELLYGGGQTWYTDYPLHDQRGIHPSASSISPASALTMGHGADASTCRNSRSPAIASRVRWRSATFSSISRSLLSAAAT